MVIVERLFQYTILPQVGLNSSAGYIATEISGFLGQNLKI